MRIIALLTLVGCSEPIDRTLSQGAWAPGARFEVNVDSRRARNWTPSTDDPSVLQVIGWRETDDGMAYQLMAVEPGEANFVLSRNSGREADSVTFRVAEADAFTVIGAPGTLLDPPHLLAGYGDAFEIRASAMGEPLCGAEVYGDPEFSNGAPAQFCDSTAQAWLEAYEPGPSLAYFGPDGLNTVEVVGVPSNEVDYFITSRINDRRGEASTIAMYGSEPVFGVPSPTWLVDDEFADEVGWGSTGSTLTYTVDNSNPTLVRAESVEGIVAEAMLPIASGSANVGCMTLPFVPALAATLVAFLLAPRRKEESSST